MRWLATDRALVWMVAAALILGALRVMLRGLHRAEQPLGLRYGVASEKPTMWMTGSNLARATGWCAVGVAALSLVLHVIAFAKGAS